MSDFSPDAVKSFNETVIEEFRANGGKVTGPFVGAPMLLLTTTGAKTGQERTSPVVHTRDGDDYVIIASKAGAPTHPDWYHNLLANPRATIEVGEDTIEVVAAPAQGEERKRLWDQQVALMPNFADYESMTSREIPVVVLRSVA